MTPAELKSARQALGLSAEGFGRVMHAAGRTVRRWEAGTLDIPGLVQDVTRALMDSRAVREYFGLAFADAPAKAGRPKTGKSQSAPI